MKCGDDTEAVAVEEGVHFDRLKGTENERLPIIFAPAVCVSYQLVVTNSREQGSVPCVELPVMHTREVGAVRLARKEVHLLKDLLHVVPVLHQQHVRLVHYHYLQRR